MSEEKTREHKLWCREGLNFTCKMCGACCGGESGFVWLSEAEKVEIASYLGIALQELEDSYLRCVKGKWSLKEKPREQNYDCLFLKEDRCSIYPVRPAQCREFPFWESMLIDKLEWDFYARHCPGMNSGRHYTLKEIENIIDGQRAKQNQLLEVKK